MTDAMTDYDMCGLTLNELGSLLNICCTDGDKIDDLEQDITTWVSTILGVSLTFEITGSLKREQTHDFKLCGNGWRLRFDGITFFSTDNKDEIKISAIHNEDEVHIVKSLRVRGNIERFKHDMSLLRMIL